MIPTTSGSFEHKCKDNQLKLEEVPAGVRCGFCHDFARPGEAEDFKTTHTHNLTGNFLSGTITHAHRKSYAIQMRSYKLGIKDGAITNLQRDTIV
jgi:hypothetical protein